MIGYVTIGTNDLERGAKFYDQLLAEIGAKRFMEEERFIAWAVTPDGPSLALTKPFDGNPATVGNGVMVALAVKTPQQVDALYAKAIELGATDEGPAGPRGGACFYAGYFRDLDGNKLNFSVWHKDMQEIIGINHIGIRVTNLDSAREFYQQLGFIFIIGPIGPEPVAIMEHPSGININLILNANTGADKNILMDVTDKYPGYTHIALDVNNIKSAQDSIEKMGIHITEGPITLPNGDVMFFIRDQDNNVIEFHQNGE